jgi:hypothetical protein
MLRKARSSSAVTNSSAGDVFARFPNRKLWALSAVGFDTTKSRAVVSLQFNCGRSLDPLVRDDCEGGTLVAVVKDGRAWSLARGADACSWKVD